MSTTTEDETLITTLRRMNAESDKFAAEQHKLTAEAAKLTAEAAKFNRDRWLAPVFAFVSALAAIGTFILAYAKH